MPVKLNSATFLKKLRALYLREFKVLSRYDHDELIGIIDHQQMHNLICASNNEL